MQQKKPLKAKTRLTAKKPIQIVATKNPHPKPTITKLKKKADKLFSQATRYRFAEQLNGEWVAECITCHIKKPIKLLQCGHFQSRRFNATRYSEENTAAQCYACNVMLHGEQYKFGIEIDKLYGDGTAKRLAKEAREPHPFTTEELMTIIGDCMAEISWYEVQIPTSQNTK